MTASYRLWINDEGTILVRLWNDTGKMEIATRPTPAHTWGPPVYLKSEATN